MALLDCIWIKPLTLALSHRKGRRRPPPTQSRQRGKTPTMLYAFDEYELDTRLYELRRAGALVQLEPKVFDLLAYLIEHGIVSRMDGNRFGKANFS